ncbi:MAG: serine/threonine-protein phosphatase [Methylococcaceae bacterium]|nr:serine/threonine-protein phosphatase [Methylococcaceae bacterium]
MKYQTATLCQQGGRFTNEDYYGSVELEDDLKCWVVADGLGGHGGGDVASKLAVETIVNTLAENPLLATETLKLQFNNAQEAVIEAQKHSLKLANMQTTAVVLIVHRVLALWGHIGDTRLYYFHEDFLQKQTSDHSVPQLLANAGEIDATEIRFHEDRNRLLRAIGSEEAFKPHLEQSPISLHSGDAFLLCTDGFWEYVFEAEMEEDLTQSSSAEEWLNAMEQRLLARAPEENDNYSAIAIIMQ